MHFLEFSYSVHLCIKFICGNSLRSGTSLDVRVLTYMMVRSSLIFTLSLLILISFY